MVAVTFAIAFGLGSDEHAVAIVTGCFLFTCLFFVVWCWSNSKKRSDT
jgi:hypothetical protein